MPRFDFDWVDAFTDQAFGGNGCAVVHNGAHLPADAACAYVRETSLVECTFTGPSDVADMRVRYFLASQEIPFAGHPTIATVAAMRDRGLISGDGCVLETLAGLVQITLSGDEIEMTQVAPQFGPYADLKSVAAAVSLPCEAIVGRPRMVSTGLPFVVTVLRDHDALRAAKLDVAELTRLRAGFQDVWAEVMEPYLVTLKGVNNGDTFSRLLLAPPNPVEDPFTGSATGAAGAYLWSEGLIQGDSYIAEQGHWMGRPGQARVTRLGAADAMTGIRVAGRAFVLMRGTVDLPLAL